MAKRGYGYVEAYYTREDGTELLCVGQVSPYVPGRGLNPPEGGEVEVLEIHVLDERGKQVGKLDYDELTAAEEEGVLDALAGADAEYADADPPDWGEDAYA